ncbi:transcriptional regulator with XRE-family HTH domain [Actinoplanes lutulentus]|uniref:Xre family transcriptional regulator n=1 Tax=Actinoplanes lutulentus TaxID=1287878 RepID=A0A327ZB89_9ACTN|nr:helix-turn-helix domain-containing protein [Actinoplanes lutulentus]MBB2945165.1 transcriptional regulator with XRE-family HTH domain [Actinoplanes lutulentus]RAK31961.1 Xre family transcriptional regulator [Actinoplanes lutulentus]
MRISHARDLGIYVREQRRAAGLSQDELATRAGVSRRWLSAFEGGKPSAEVGLVFHVIVALGMFVDVSPEPPRELDLDEYLKRFDGPQ